MSDDRSQRNEQELATFLRRIDVTEWVDAVSGWMPLRAPPVLCLVLMFVEHHVPTLLTLRLVSRTFQVAVDRLPHWHGLLPSCRQLQRKVVSLRLVDRVAGTTPSSERGWATPSEARDLSPWSECGAVVPSITASTTVVAPGVSNTSPFHLRAAEDEGATSACARHACHHKPDGPKAANRVVRETFKQLTDNEKAMHRRSLHRGLGSLVAGLALFAATVAYSVIIGLFVTSSFDAFVAVFLVFMLLPFVVVPLFRNCCENARQKTACLRLLPAAATLLPAILFGTLTALLTGHHEGSRLLAYDNAELNVCGIVSPEMAHPALIDAILSRLASSTADSPPFLVVNTSTLSFLNESDSYETCPAVQRAIADALWGTEVNITDSSGLNATAQPPLPPRSYALAATVAVVAPTPDAVGTGAVAMKTLLPLPRDVELRRGWPTIGGAASMWTEAEALRWSVAAKREPPGGAPPFSWVSPTPQLSPCASVTAGGTVVSTTLNDSQSAISEDVFRLSRRTAATYHAVRTLALDHPCFCRVVLRDSAASPSRFLLNRFYQCVPLGLVNDGSSGSVAPIASTSALSPNTQLPLDTDTTPCNVSLWPCRRSDVFVRDFGLVCSTWQANVMTEYMPPSSTVNAAPFVVPKPVANSATLPTESISVANDALLPTDRGDTDFWRSVGILIELDSSEVSRRASAPHPSSGKTVRSVRFPKGTLFELSCPATVLRGSTCDADVKSPTIASCTYPLLRYTALIPSKACTAEVDAKVVRGTAHRSNTTAAGSTATTTSSTIYYAVPVMIASAAAPFWERHSTYTFSPAVIAPLESFRRAGTRAPRTLDADWTSSYAQWLYGATRSNPHDKFSKLAVERLDCASNLGPGLTMAQVVSDDGLLLQTAFRMPVFGSVRDTAIHAAIVSLHARDTSGEGFVLVAEGLHHEGPYPMVSSVAMRYLRESVYAPALSVTLVCWVLVSLPSIVVFPLVRTRVAAERCLRFWLFIVFGPLNGAIGIGIGAYCVTFSGTTDETATQQPLMCLSTNLSMVLVLIASSFSVLFQISLMLGCLSAR